MAISVLEQIQRGFEKARTNGWDLSEHDAECSDDKDNDEETK